MKKTETNILIIEDEFIIAQDISEVLIEDGYVVTGIAEDIESAISIINEKEVNLILLDINLNQPVDGIQIAHIINTDYQLPFIFVTAFTDSATIEKVKHTRPYGYISKPFNDIDILIAIELAISKYKFNTEVKSSDFSISKNSFFIKTKNGIEKVNSNEIRWMEAFDYYSFIQLETKKILATTTLKDLESKITNPSFIKVHRKYSVNINYINKLVGNKIEIDGTLIPVSRLHKYNLLKKLHL